MRAAAAALVLERASQEPYSRLFEEHKCEFEENGCEIDFYNDGDDVLVTVTANDAYFAIYGETRKVIIYYEDPDLPERVLGEVLRRLKHART